MKPDSSWIQKSKHWFSVARQQDLPLGGIKPTSVSKR